MQDVTLVQGGTQRSVHPVFEVERPLPGDYMREEIAVECGVFLQQRVQGQHGFCGDELVQADLARRYPGPVARRQSVVGVGPVISNLFEDQCRLPRVLASWGRSDTTDTRDESEPVDSGRMLEFGTGTLAR